MEKTLNRKKALLSGIIIFVLVLVAGTMCLPVSASADRPEDPGQSEGLLKKVILSRKNLLDVRLSGVTSYEVTEMFNSLLEKASGVKEAKRFRQRLEPDSPMECLVIWQVEIDGTDLFDLESGLYNMARKAAKEQRAEAFASLAFTPSEEDFELLGKIRPWSSGPGEIIFVAGNFASQREKHPLQGQVLPVSAVKGDRGFE